MQKAKSLSSMLQRGLTVPRSDRIGFAPIKPAVPTEGGAEAEAVVGLVDGGNIVDPGAAGVVASLNRPGGNATGLALLITALSQLSPEPG